MIGQLEEIVARALVGLYTSSGFRASLERVEWVCRFPRQKRPGVEKGRMRMGGQVVAFAAPGQACSHENVMAFLGIDIFSYSIVNECLLGVARRDRLLAPCDDWIGFCVEAAVNRGATRDDILETLAMAVYIEYSRASRLWANNAG